VPLTNTLAYYLTEVTIVLKSFNGQSLLLSLTLLSNIRLGQKGVLVTHTLAYYLTEFTTALKSLKVQSLPLSITLLSNIRLGQK
jgi:hypothetical protein